MLYSQSDILKNYKKLQLQTAILEYVATHNGTTGGGPEIFLTFSEYIDKTLHWKTQMCDITQAGLYLIAIKLLTVEEHKLYITEEGIKYLQNCALQAATISTRLNFISHSNWIICTLISLTALVISILK